MTIKLYTEDLHNFGTCIGCQVTTNKRWHDDEQDRFFSACSEQCAEKVSADFKECADARKE